MMPFRLPFLLVVFMHFLSHNLAAKVQYCPESERKALQHFKHNISFDPNYSVLSSWDNGDDCGHWEGVFCNLETGNIVNLNFVLDYGQLEPTKLLNGNNLLPLLSLNYLVSLSLSGTDFRGNRIPKSTGSFKHLIYLYLYGFTGRILSEVGNLSTLERLELHNNYGLFIDNIAWLSQLKSLRYLGLSGVNMSAVSEWLQVVNTLTNMSELHLSNCGLTSLPPLSFVNFTSLTAIDFSYNNISSTLPDWLWQLENLMLLDVSHNSFNGTLHSAIGNLSLLRQLDLSNNKFNGQIPKTIAKLWRLEKLNIGSNYFKCKLVEAQVSNMSRLTSLNLSYNYLVFETSEKWIPSFQLEDLHLDFCQVGPQLPSSLKTQHSLCTITASNAGIKALAPNWFGSLSPCDFLYIDLSNNHISGKISQFINPYISYLDLSNNLISGTIPIDLGKRMKYLNYLDMSNNKLNGSIPLSFCSMTELQYLIFTSNKLSGVLPDCWTSSTFLENIQLSDNYIHGKLPVSMCNLSLINLHLNNNILSGTLPSCLTNITTLLSLDLGYNKFSGKIPSWNGSKGTFLVILSLRSNAFTGGIPDLSSLQGQVLDLSYNNLSGYIPPSLGYLSAMTTPHVPTISTYSMFLSRNDTNEILRVVTKGKEYQYNIKLLPLLMLIDLSNNALAGDIPNELVKLHGLQTLNLSGNHLTGKIPIKIDGLQQLESLDLSRNNLSGETPSSLTNLHFLSHLNLSNNNLYGKIPTGGQLQALDDSFIYQNNPYLCGPPLKNLCQEDYQHSSIDNNDHELIALYMAIAPGFVVGFWIVWGTLILHRKWRSAYFQAIDRVYYMFV